MYWHECRFLIILVHAGSPYTRWQASYSVSAQLAWWWIKVITNHYASGRKEYICPLHIQGRRPSWELLLRPISLLLYLLTSRLLSAWISFLKDLQPAWPNFVLQWWEGIPKCEGYLLESHVNLVRPSSTCDNLIINGDMEEGAYYWLRGKGAGAFINDVLFPIKGKGLNDSSVALRCG